MGFWSKLFGSKDSSGSEGPRGSSTESRRTEADKAVDAFMHPDTHCEGDVEDMLVRNGMKSEDAKKLSCFIPSAFARVALANSGVRFPDYYTVMSDPRLTPREYAKEPLFTEAIEAARRHIDAGKMDVVNYLVAWSVEGKLGPFMAKQGEQMTGSLEPPVYRI